MRKQYTTRDREQFLEEVRSSGNSVKVVAGRLGIGASTAYLWKQKQQGAAQVVAPRFARLVPEQRSPPAALTVQLGRVAIRVEAGFDAELLRTVVEALSDGSQ